MNRKNFPFVSLLLLLSVSLALSGTGKYDKKREKRARRKGTPIEETDPRLSTYRYINDRTEFGGLTMIVGTDLARFRLDALYVPFGVSLALEEPVSIEIRPALFYLEDQEEEIYKPVPLARIIEQDESRLELLHNYQLYKSMVPAPGFHFLGRLTRRKTNFYSPPGESLPIDNTELGGGTYFSDLLYFENPGRIEEQILTLTYEDKKAEKSINVRFRLYPPKMLKKLRKKEPERFPRNMLH